jgi:hypothetical protein
VRLARATTFILLGVLVFACSKTPSEKDLVDAMISWIGTGDVASQAWLNHTTFDHYTEQTLELSAQKLGEQTSQLKTSAPSHPVALDSAVTNAGHAMTMIAKLIAANDAPDVQPQLDSLRAAKKIVLAISDSLAKEQ